MKLQKSIKLGNETGLMGFFLKIPIASLNWIIK